MVTRKSIRMPRFAIIYRIQVNKAELGLELF